MPTEEFIIAVYCRVDEVLGDEPQHPQAKRYPSEAVTLALRYALKGVGERAFYRWLARDYAALFPALPERTRLFRLFAAHRAWADRFLAAPSVLGLADSDGIELRHPRRHGRTARQLGTKGLSNHRWIAGGKRCVLINSGVDFRRGRRARGGRRALRGGSAGVRARCPQGSGRPRWRAVGRRTRPPLPGPGKRGPHWVRVVLAGRSR